MTGRKKGEKFEKLLGYHECSLHELERFPSPAPDSIGLMNHYRKDNNRLYCLDHEDANEVEIWGNTNNEDAYARFEFVLVPCNYVHAEIEVTDDKVSDECIADREK